MPQNEMLFKELNRWAQNKGGESIDFDELRKRGRIMLALHDIEISDKDFSDTITDVLENIEVVLGAGDDVHGADFKPWFQEWRGENETPRWDRYAQYLLEEKGWGPEVIKGLDVETSHLIDLAGDPHAAGEWYRRGLAIGEVQSGKTANYIGVLNKALDSGYKLIIVIGGHTNDLRRQTQERVDSDLLGFDTAFLPAENAMGRAGWNSAAIGVGKVDNSPSIPHRLTSVLGDFSKSNKSTQGVTIGQQPTVAVVKKHAGTSKNPGTLNNLAAFLRQQAPDGRLDIPMLIIDDESDWASVNTKDEENVVAVNDAIRTLLDASKKSSYLAFTATPFANVLINAEVEKDLFPKDYIRALPSPSNYLGADKHHSSQSRKEHPHRLQTDVHDMLDRLPYGHKVHNRLEDVPPSLANAIHAFFIGSAVRRLRDGRARPASMMINVSSFNAVQDSVYEQVKRFVETTASTLRAELGAELPSESQKIKDMREVLRTVYPDLEGEVSWTELTRPLTKIADEIHTTLVNGRTTKETEKHTNSLSREDRKAYQSRPVVQVGGNVLSRGLTLEGLQVSYFLRRAGAADTLLQMGRWFGYRPRYEDLVRVWIDEEVVDLFDYAREISDELRSSVGEMKRLDLTPKDFGLRIRKHPETFRITAANKQRHAEVVGEVFIHGSVFPSVFLSSAEQQLAANREAANSLAKRLTVDHAQLKVEDAVWRDVPAGVVREFFQTFAASAADPFLGPHRSGESSQILEALSTAVNGDHWDVKFMSGSGTVSEFIGSGAHAIEVRPSIRNAMRLVDQNTIMLGNRRLAAENDLLKALPETARKRVTRRFAEITSQPSHQGSKTSMSDTFVAREGLERPLLLVYTLGVDGNRNLKDEYVRSGLDERGIFEKPLSAAQVAFPKLTDESEMRFASSKGTQFVANTVYQQVIRSYAEPGDDDLDEE